MLARYYSQGYARFLSPDPGYDYDQLDPMSWNLYVYVRGNPVQSVDPTGFSKEEVQIFMKWLHFTFQKALNDSVKEKVEYGLAFQKVGDRVFSRFAKIFKGVEGKKESVHISIPNVPTAIGMFHTHRDGTLFSIKDIKILNDSFSETHGQVKYSVLYNAKGGIFVMEMKGTLGPAKIGKLLKIYNNESGSKSSTKNQEEAINEALDKVFNHIMVKSKIILYKVTVSEKDGKLYFQVEEINQDKEKKGEK